MHCKPQRELKYGMAVEKISYYLCTWEQQLSTTR